MRICLTKTYPGLHHHLHQCLLWTVCYLQTLKDNQRVGKIIKHHLAKQSYMLHCDFESGTFRLFNQTIGDILRQRPINIHLSIAISLKFLFLPCNMPYMFYMCPVKLDNDLPATVDASFFRLLKLSAPSWFKIPGNISAISEKNINKSIKICVCCLKFVIFW